MTGNKTWPKWLKELVKAIITAILAALGTIFAVGCASSHTVTQSSYNTSTGDSIVIRYEQTGNFKK